MTLINAMDQNTMRELDVHLENRGPRSFGHLLSVDFLQPDPEVQKIIDLARPRMTWGHERPSPLPFPFLRHELRRDQDLTPCSIQTGELDATFGRSASVDTSSTVRRRSDAFGLQRSYPGFFEIDPTLPSEFRFERFVV
jgi:hypothetical protein